MKAVQDSQQAWTLLLKATTAWRADLTCFQPLAKRSKYSPQSYALTGTGEVSLGPWHRPVDSRSTGLSGSVDKWASRSCNSHSGSLAVQGKARETIQVPKEQHSSTGSSTGFGLLLHQLKSIRGEAHQNVVKPQSLSLQQQARDIRSASSQCLLHKPRQK